MFEGMEWDMEAAADQKEDCAFFPEQDEDEHSFSVPPAVQPVPQPDEEPREPIARCDVDWTQPWLSRSSRRL